MWLRTWLITIGIFAAGVERSLAADLSAVFNPAGLTLNHVVLGSMANDHGQLSLAAFTQILGLPTRSRVDGGTQRITWDDEGIQVETTAQESVPFAVLFEFASPDSTDQGVIPGQRYPGTFDCLGINLYTGEQTTGQATLLSAAGFSKDTESASGETWSRRLEYWAVYLEFSATGVIKSAVIRVLPDIY